MKIIQGYAKGINVVEEDHDRFMIYSVQYCYNGKEYPGEAKRGCDWYRSFTTDYFERIFKGAEIYLRIDEKDNDYYIADLDFSAVYALGKDYSGSCSSFQIEVKKVLGIDNCVLLNIDGYLDYRGYIDHGKVAHEHFLKAIFYELTKGASKIIINIKNLNYEIEGIKILLMEAWHYIYTIKKTNRILIVCRKDDQSKIILNTVCSKGEDTTCSDSIDDITDCMLSLMTDAEKEKHYEKKKIEADKYKIGIIKKIYLLKKELEERKTYSTEEVEILKIITKYFNEKNTSEKIIESTVNQLLLFETSRGYFLDSKY